MDFKLHSGHTEVDTTMTVEKKCDGDLILDGEEATVILISLALDGVETLEEGVDYVFEPGKLIIRGVALERAASSNNGNMIVKTSVCICPESNTQLSGLYKSGPMFCSQCEAEGFRRITYYPDRPDNMAIFTVRVEADASYQVLLSNGNLVEEGECGEGETKRKFAVWSDPFPKPSYLFALVAGDLGCVDDSFTTMSGRKVALRFYSEHQNTDKLNYAVESLKRAMRWDEEKFGREYDLDLFNVVAVESFNMGAMENKSLNVFNTSCVLADPVTSSDENYYRVEGIIGHEYFHNWTGNRVTCRDWFQLTLKEGLTVDRDQEFSGDVNNCKTVTRIKSVQVVRGGQFKEDAGPMSHPCRPESYVAMDNFYTNTVYRKGSEVVRMYATLLGEEGFRKGMDLYFDRHDGCAVTCDDFLSAMADANGVDLSQFSRWYATSGTPVVTWSSNFDNGTGKFTLTLTQSSRSEEPLLIPVSVGLLDKDSGDEVVPTTVLQLKEKTQSFDFPSLKGDVVPSLLRNWSAPVKLNPSSGIVDEVQLSFLASRDTDLFNRWDSGQQLFAVATIKHLKRDTSFEETLARSMDAFGRTLDDENISDDSIRAYALSLPSEGTLAEMVSIIDPPAIRESRSFVKKAIARKHKNEIAAAYGKLTKAMAGSKFSVDGVSVGRRRLRNVLLGYLCSITETAGEQKEAAEIATNHFITSTGMTDKLAALSLLASMGGEGENAREAAIERFYNDANADPLVLNKWFACQAGTHLPDALDRVVKLTSHKDFTLTNPNRARSVILSFTMNAAFHDLSGDGYSFVGRMIAELDPINSKVAARTTAGCLIGWARYSEQRQALMKAELQKLKSLEGISSDLLEIVSKGLK